MIHAVPPPGYWMWETSGVLRPVIEAYVRGSVALGGPPAMTPHEVATMRAYLRQWIEHPSWMGPEADELRASVNGLDSRARIAAWLDRAVEAGIDPL